MIRIPDLCRIVIVALVVISCQKEFEYPITAEKISDQIMTYECLDVKVSAIKSEKGLIIIDTEHCPAIMSEIKKRIEKDLDCSTYLYVINTHGHWDHASGNQVFPESVLVGHEKCPGFMQRGPANQMTTLWYIQGRLLQLKHRTERADDHEAQVRIREIMLDDLENNYRVTPPTITFTDSLFLDAGDMTLKLFYCGNAHTNNDIVVYIPELKVLHTGDLINTPGSYSFTMHKLNDIPRIIEVLDRIIQDSSGIEYVIPSHTDIMTRDDLIGTKELIREEYEPFVTKKSAVVLLKNFIENHELSAALLNYEYSRRQDKRDYYVMEEEFKTYGMQLFWEGNDSAAVSVFRVGLSEFPESALLTYNLANIFFHLEQTDSAVHYYERSLEIFPENRTAAQILKMISND
jgi:glyoxylase-like metal-dependent hydrolase (beta-lactamase superfamily II)